MQDANKLMVGPGCRAFIGVYHTRLFILLRVVRSPLKTRPASQRVRGSEYNFLIQGLTPSLEI